MISGLFGPNVTHKPTFLNNPSIFCMTGPKFETNGFAFILPFFMFVERTLLNKGLSVNRTRKVEYTTSSFCLCVIVKGLLLPMCSSAAAKNIGEINYTLSRLNSVSSYGESTIYVVVCTLHLIIFFS